MTIYIGAMIAVIAAGVVLALTFGFRLSRRPIQQRRYDLARELRPFVAAERQARYMDDDALWREIRLAGGLRSMFRAAGEIVGEAARRKSLDPSQQSLCERTLIISIWLRLMLPWCGFEAALCRELPMLPRVFAWVIARLYCELISTLQAMPNPA